MIDQLAYSDVCGLFGKLPQQADFVNLHLSEPITTVWHRWLSNGLSVSREQLDERWLNYYLTSPVWRFVISPGVLDHTGMAGLMIPCVDAIGRYFPLVVGAMGHFDYWAATATGQSWYETLEHFALNILEEQLDYQGLTTELTSLALPSFFSHTAFATQHCPKDLTRTLSLSTQLAGTSDTLTHTLFNTLLRAQFDKPCLWWTQGSDHIAPCLQLTDGLPSPGQFAALLDGQWQHWGWAEVQSFSIEPLTE